MKYDILNTLNEDLKTFKTNKWFCSEIESATREEFNEKTISPKVRKIMEKLFVIEEISEIFIDEEGSIDIEKTPPSSWEDLLPKIKKILDAY